MVCSSVQSEKSSQRYIQISKSMNKCVCVCVYICTLHIYTFILECAAWHERIVRPRPFKFYLGHDVVDMSEFSSAGCRSSLVGAVPNATLHSLQVQMPPALCYLLIAGVNPACAERAGWRCKVCEGLALPALDWR